MLSQTHTCPFPGSPCPLETLGCYWGCVFLPKSGSDAKAKCFARFSNDRMFTCAASALPPGPDREAQRGDLIRLTPTLYLQHRRFLPTACPCERLAQPGRCRGTRGTFQCGPQPSALVLGAHRQCAEVRCGVLTPVRPRHPGYRPTHPTVYPSIFVK